jgi:hypothetical protein
MSNTIQPIDVKFIAASINKTLTEEQINEVLEMYPTEQESDPTGTWNLVIENCIYQVLR